MITGSLIFMKEISLSSLQQMQLSLILTSLYDNNHISTLLGFSDSADHVTSSQPCDGSVDLMLAEILMKTILRNLANETVSKVNNHLCKLSIEEWRNMGCTCMYNSLSFFYEATKVCRKVLIILWKFKLICSVIIIWYFIE